MLASAPQPPVRPGSRRELWRAVRDAPPGAACFKNPFYAARVSASRAGFRPILPSNCTDACGKCLVFRTFRPSAKARPAGRFSAPDVATCTISRREKNVENQLDSGYTLAATTWPRCGRVPPATFVAQHVPNEIGACAFAAERRYSGGSQTSARRRTWDVNCPPEPSPRKAAV
jgi:hypothetical protein